MAQSGSCQNPDLSNCAIVHDPLDSCSDLDTQRERGDEEGEDEDEEVELAEEVGEDIVMMAEAVEEQVEREREQGDAEEVRLIQVALSPNGVMGEGEGERETLEENQKESDEEEDKEEEKIDEQTSEEESEGRAVEESKNTKTVVVEMQSHLSPLMGQNQLFSQNTENEKTDEEAFLQIPETYGSEENVNEGDSELNKYQMVPTTDDAETAEESRIVEDPGSETISLVNNTVTETAYEQTNDVASNNTGIEEQVPILNEPYQTSAVSNNVSLFGVIKVMDDQTTEKPEEMQDADYGKSDCIEAKVKDEEQSEFALDDVLDIPCEANPDVAQLDLAFVASKSQSQTEGGIEETRLEGINQKAQEEEQVRQVGVNTLIVTDEFRKSKEEVGLTGDNVVSDIINEKEHRGRGEKEMQEESNDEFAKQDVVAPLEPVEHFEEDVPLDTKQDLDLDQVDEAFELDEGGEVEVGQPRGEVTSEESGLTTDGAVKLQEDPLQNRKEIGTDWGNEVGEQQRMQDVVEDEEGDASLGEVEMAEEPVTVLDDEFDETQTRDHEEQKASNFIAAICDDVNVETKDEECQEQVQTEEDGKQRVEMQEVEIKEEKPKDDHRMDEMDINGKVKVLKQAMENGILCPEPQPFRKEGWGTSRMRSPRRKDNDWIKNDQPEEKKEPELKDWRKELKPVKKDVWENERGRKEWVKKDSLTEVTGLPKKEDWIKELKSVIKNESLPKKKDEQVKKKRVVLMEDGRSYVPQREEMTEERKEEVKLISHKKVEIPSPYVRRNSKTPEDQDYEISLYVKVMNHMNTVFISLTLPICIMIIVLLSMVDRPLSSRMR